MVFESESQQGGAQEGEYAEPIAVPDEQAPDPGTIDADPPRNWSMYCSDGARDDVSEECDAGPVAQNDGRSVCSPNCQTRDLVLVEPFQGGDAAERRLGLGRHPLSGSELTGGVVWVERGLAEPLPSGGGGSVPQVILQALDRQGNPTSRLVVADAGTEQQPTVSSNPVVAALPNGDLAVAYNDLNGDGDGLGIAWRLISFEEQAPPGEKWTLHPPSFVNDSTMGPQQDADLVWTREGMIAAWTDFSDHEGPAIKSRHVLNGLQLNTGAGELQLSQFAGPARGGVALTALPLVPENQQFGIDPTWAAVWREGQDDGPEAIVVYTEQSIARVEPALVDDTPADAGAAMSGQSVERLMPGHENDRPAVAPLFGNRVALAFTVGTDPEMTGVASVFRLWVAVVDARLGIVESAQSVEPLIEPFASDPTLGMRQPSLLNVGVDGQVYLAWRSYSPIGSGSGEELWLKRIDWDEENESLDLSSTEVPLQRDVNHNEGNQRSPSLGAFLVPGNGTFASPALGIAWEDWGVQYSADQGRPEVVFQLAPVPLRRGEPVEKDCSVSPCDVGEGPCGGDEQCQSGLVCQAGRGPWYDLGYTTPICGLATCNDGIQNGDEEGTDCGGSCGQCFQCPDEVTYWGTANFCSLVCPCDRQDGDCDEGLECSSGLECVEDSGDLLGLPQEIDFCDYPHCHDGQQNEDETRLDCGGADCLPCDVGSPSFCVEAECGLGEGDCSAPGAACAAPLVCDSEAGVLFGLGNVGACVEPTCSADRGNPYDPDFCSPDCQCPSGLGLCDSDAECSASRCVDDRGLYFGLNAEDPVCVADHCFDGVENYDETALDCGGGCGNECPACDLDPSFSSFENLAHWGEVVYWLPGVEPSSNLSSDSEATDGAASLRYGACNFFTVGAKVIDGTQFDIVGDELLFDVQFLIGGGGYSWDWVGSIDLKIWIDGTEYHLGTSGPFTRTSANQWHTVRFDVPSAVREAFLSGDRQIQLRLGLDRNCSVAGSAEGAVLLDNLRFAGDAVWRSECEPDAGSGGTGTGGTGGSDGTGGTPGSGGGDTGGSSAGGGGAGGSSGGGGGAGGSSGGGGGSGGVGGSGGTGGSGGSSQTVTGTAALIFGFEDVSLWTGSMGVSFDTTEGLQSLVGPGSSYRQYTGGPFSANEVGESGTLLVDLKLPPVAPGQSNLSGGFSATFECPSAGLWGAYQGDIQFSDKPSEQWFTAGIPVSQAAQDALATNATDCTLRVSTNLYGQQAGTVVLVDNLRFEAPSHCTTYFQQPTPPFSVGMPVVPNGSSAAPFPICNAAQLSHLANDSSLWSKAFVLEADVDLTNYSGQIGSSATPFTGTFDGKGHTLVGYSRLSTADRVGFFGTLVGDGVLDGVQDGHITHLQLSDFDVSGGDFVGALVGYAEGAYLSDVAVFDSAVSGAGATIGGLAGAFDGIVRDTEVHTTVESSAGSAVGGMIGLNQGNILDSAAYGSVSVQGALGPAGGLVGIQSGGLISSCEAHGSVASDAAYAGGLVGHLLDGATLDDSATDGEVTLSAGAWYAGGLVGGVSNGSEVNGCATFGPVSASRFAGGLVGELDSSTLRESASFGPVTALQSEAGGLVAFANNAVVVDSASLSTVEALSESAGGICARSQGLQILRTYVRGPVSAPASPGAVAGTNVRELILSDSFVSAVAHDGLSLVGSDGSFTGANSLSESDFGDQAVFEAAGWDFDDVWIMGVWGPELR